MKKKEKEAPARTAGWLWFEACEESGFVNCWFGDAACCNPQHRPRPRRVK